MYQNTISKSRLSSFKLSDNDTEEILLQRYIDNIKLSESLYPALSLLEVTLRNSIDIAIETLLKENWLLKEIEENALLSEKEHQKLVIANNIIKQNYGNDNVTKGKLISELNFGFWVFLCSTKYNPKLWTKKNFFKTVFPNYPSNKKPAINEISYKLQKIRKLRNRVYHYEPILKYGTSLLNTYGEILNILGYLPQDSLNILQKTCRFKDVYNETLLNGALIAQNPKHCTHKV